jgi:N-acetylneuraminic acid mutarotase
MIYDHGIAVVGDGWVFSMYGFYNDEVQDEVTIYEPEEESWTFLPLMHTRPPPRRQFQSVSGINEGFYILFGRAPHRLLNDVWYFNFLNRTWNELSANSWVVGVEAPEPRMSSCCDMNDEQTGIVCYGGTDARQKWDDLWLFDLTKNRWTEIFPTAASPRPSARDLAICGFKRNRFTVLLGENATYAEVNDHWVFDMATRMWTRLANAPFTRLNGGGCLVADDLLITSGETGEDFTNSVWKLSWDSWKWTKLREDYFIPPPRAAAAYARVGSELYLMWGDGILGANDDVWKFDLESGKWEFVQDVWVDKRPRFGKIGASAIDKGTMIMVFGGIVEQGGKKVRTNELLTFDVSEDVNEWEELDILGAKPPRRSHAAFTRVGELMYLFGGFDENSMELGDMWVFNPVYQIWSELKGPVGSAWPAPRYGPSFIPLEIKSSVVISGNPRGYKIVARLGLLGGSDGGGERWEAIVGQNVLNETQYVTNMRLFPTSLPVGYEPVQFSRVQASVIGSGANWILCGGSTDEDFAGYGESVECFGWNADTGATTVSVGEMPVNIMSAAVVPYQNRFYIIGGYYLDSEVVRDNPTSFVQYYEVDSKIMCAGGTDASNCWLCSDGTYYDTKNKSCVNSPPGYFIEDPGTDPEPCVAGEFSSDSASTSAMTCLPCPEGSYAPKPGMAACLPCPPKLYCPFRAKEAVDPKLKGAPEDMTDVPPPYEDGDIPPSEYVAFYSAIIAGFGIVVIFFSMHKICNYVELHRTLREEDIAEIRKTINRHDPFGDGVDGSKLFLILTDLCVSDLSEDESYRMVQQHDTEGTIVLFPKQLLRLCSHLVQNKRLDFGNENIVPLGFIINYFAKFSFKNWDSFVLSHDVTGPGEPVLKVSNQWGGMLTLSYYVVGAIFAVLLITTFHYSNISETRSSLPAVVARRKAFANIKIRVSTKGDDDSTNCVLSTGECIPGMIISHQGFIPGPGNEYKTRCEFIAPRSCVAYWECKLCSIESVSAYVDTIFFEEDWFSSLNEVTIEASSGVPEDLPARSYSFMQPPNGSVFLGFPASQFVAEMTQTLTKAPKSAWEQEPIIKSGYHVRFLNGENKDGNTAVYSEFPHIYRIPLRVVLREGEGVLLITRFAKSPVIDLISAVIGGVSGLAGLFVMMMLALDESSRIRRKRAIKEEAKDRARDSGLTWEMKDQFVATSPRSIAKYLRSMLSAHFSYRQAKAIYEMTRAVHD